MLNKTIVNCLIDSCDIGCDPDGFINFLQNEAEEFAGSEDDCLI